MLSVWKFNIALAVISASVVILTAAYILWTIQRVYLGAEYNGPHEEELKPITAREFSIAAPLFVLAIVFGLFPRTVLKYMDNTIDRQVEDLADWTRDVADPTETKEKQQQAETPLSMQPKKKPSQHVDVKKPNDQVVNKPGSNDVSHNQATSGVP